MRKLFCLLGDPVEHSRSPAICARAFALLGVDAVYAPCGVAPEELRVAIDGLRALGAAGFNVTVPHKESALKIVDRVAPDAQAIGAVNCVVREGGALVAHNTDAPGLLRSLAAAGVDPAGAAAAIVGAGGAAKAAAAALAGRVRTLAILNRTAGKAEALARSLASRESAKVTAAPLESDAARRALSGAALVVHCTTVGMGTAELPFDTALLARSACVVDLVYAGAPGTRAGDTALVRAARARGLRVVDGIDVLVHQAIASLEIWLGRPRLGELFTQLREAAISLAFSEQGRTP